jgi:hypothetical protein
MLRPSVTIGLALLWLRYLVNNVLLDALLGIADERDEHAEQKVKCSPIFPTVDRKA